MANSEARGSARAAVRSIAGRLLLAVPLFAAALFLSYKGDTSAVAAINVAAPVGAYWEHATAMGTGSVALALAAFAVLLLPAGVRWAGLALTLTVMIGAGFGTVTRYMAGDTPEPEALGPVLYANAPFFHLGIPPYREGDGCAKCDTARELGALFRQVRAETVGQVNAFQYALEREKTLEGAVLRRMGEETGDPEFFKRHMGDTELRLSDEAE